MLTQAIPVTIISGFLGCGKTTLLNRIMQADTGLRIAVMVNDFGQINIDSKMVVNNNGKVMNLANGCICCSISDDLIGQLESLLAQEQAPETILIEASGVSDPGRIARTLKYPQFRGRLELDAILTLVDAGQILTLDEEFRQLAMAQLEAADIVIINKTDQCSAQELAAIREEWLFPDSRVYETCYADVPLALIIATHSHMGETAPEGGSDNSHTHQQEKESTHSDIFESLSWQADQPVNLARLRAIIEGLPVGIYRAKGIFGTEEMPGTPVVLQQVGSRSQWAKGGQGIQADCSSVVFIGRRGEFDGEALLAQLNTLIIKKEAIV